MFISILKELLRPAKLGYLKAKWKKKYPDTGTIPMNVFDFDHIEVGNNSYGELNVLDFGGTSKLIIKHYVSIAQNVTFVLNAEHHTDHISTYPFRVRIVNDLHPESFGKGNIIVENDVWIGYGVTVMSGVHIGQGAIVSAGTVITKDVPPYAIVGGIPAKVIKYRFKPELIKELLKIDYSKLTKDDVKVHIDDLYEKLNNKSQLDWLPKF